MRALLVLFLLPLLLGATWPAAGSSRPALRISGASPLIVRGNGFRAKETVRLTVRTDSAKRAARTLTTARGTFALTVDLPVPYDPCSAGLAIAARGTEGDAASLKLVPRECPPAP